MTTATVALTHGQWELAARTIPLAYLAAGLVVGTAPVLLGRVTGKVAPPRPWSPAARQRTTRAMHVIVALSWIFQLHRYRFL